MSVDKSTKAPTSSDPFKIEKYKAKNHVRFVTAASLFDGHDAAINIMRRILQSTGVEVIHLGHNRSVKEVIDAAIQEDVHGIAISSYQGGHIEYFKYMIDLLKENNASHIKIFGGGGVLLSLMRLKSYTLMVFQEFIHRQTVNQCSYKALSMR